MSAPPPDIPPPPYSEIDIYSATTPHSVSAVSAVSAPSQRARSHGSDDAASLHPSASSSAGDVIYTPPLTPHSGSHHLGPNDDVADRLSTSSAAAYFDSRPAQFFHAEPVVVHPIAVRHGSSPDDFPYPAQLDGRDVRLEDWQTFLNYLLPHHSALSNSHVVERKLRAEGSDGSSEAQAQLDPIRTPAEATRRRQNVQDTVREWNDGFFSPRGVAVRLEQADEPATEKIPGAWSRSFDHGDDTAGPSRERLGSNNHGRGGSLRIGGIVMSDDYLSIGRNIVADRNGLRVGSIVADSSGLSIGGSPLFPGARGGRRGPLGSHLDQRGWRRGGSLGRFSGPGWGGSDNPRSSCHAPPGRPLAGRGGGLGGLGRGGGDWARGRQHHREEAKSRSSSASSSSSDSSQSSTDSESSVGSLPAYSDLEPAQLPVARSYLRQALDHPDRPITKDDVRRAREQIAAAKGRPAAATSPAALAQEKALGLEVRGLMQGWKAHKRSQKQARRALKRQRRQERRTAKRVAKEERRRGRRERREHRRNSRRQFGRGGPGAGFDHHAGARQPWWASSVIASTVASAVSAASSSSSPHPPPPAPHGVSAPPVPPGPPMPHAAPGFGPFGRSFGFRNRQSWIPGAYSSGPRGGQDHGHGKGHGKGHDQGHGHGHGHHGHGQGHAGGVRTPGAWPGTVEIDGHEAPSGPIIEMDGTSQASFAVELDDTSRAPSAVELDSTSRAPSAVELDSKSQAPSGRGPSLEAQRRSIEVLEREVAVKKAELAGVRGQKGGCSNSRKKIQSRSAELEDELGGLQKRLQSLQLDADAALAWEIAQEDMRHHK